MSGRIPCLALLATLSVALSACDGKRGPAATKPSAADAPMHQEPEPVRPKTARAPDAGAAAAMRPPLGPVGIAAKFGVPSCDAYARAVLCYTAKLAAKQRQLNRDSFKRLHRLWRSFDRTRLAAACDRAFAAWKAAHSGHPAIAKCL